MPDAWKTTAIYTPDNLSEIGRRNEFRPHRLALKALFLCRRVSIGPQHVNVYYKKDKETQIETTYQLDLRIQDWGWFG